MVVLGRGGIGNFKYHFCLPKDGSFFWLVEVGANSFPSLVSEGE